MGEIRVHSNAPTYLLFTDNEATQATLQTGYGHIMSKDEVIKIANQLIETATIFEEEIAEHNKKIEDEFKVSFGGWGDPNRQTNKQRIQEKKEKEFGYIYLLKSKDKYKIGIAKDVNKRVRNIQRSIPFNIDIIGKTYTNCCYDKERYLHNYFSKKRINGEWFKLNVDDLIFIKNFFTKEQTKIKGNKRDGA